ncbi:MAG: phosphomannomutase/phosphoglucomutase [Thermodesulfobacteriota bacterium]
MNPAIFREYDIRGRCPEDLNPETARHLGLSIGTYYRERGVDRVSLGRDCRLSSPELKEGLLGGLLDTGVDVLDVGMVPTPLLYFSLFQLEVGGGVQITGSHNPPDYNGFKVCLGRGTLFGEEIQKIRKIAESGRYRQGKGKEESREIVRPYLAHLQENLKPGREKRRVVVDAGNGVAGLVAPEAYRRMGLQVDPLFCEPDGRFPNHHPDPTIPGYLQSLISRVAEGSADLGIAFDGDGDRIGVVDREGRIIWGDQLMILFSRHILGIHPGAKIIGEVKCSQALYDDIRRHGGIPIMWKAGHSLIKGKMREEGALFGGEMSGHLFFADRYFGFDDAVYAGARLLEILTHTQEDLSALLSDVPQMVSTPEIRMDCPDEKKFQVVAELAEDFKKDHEVIDIDGARVLFEGGWGLVRASNTQPVMVLRFEARDRETLEKIRAIFMERVEKRLRG